MVKTKTIVTNSEASEETLLEVMISMRDMIKVTYEKQFQLLQCELHTINIKMDTITEKLVKSENEHIKMKKENCILQKRIISLESSVEKFELKQDAEEQKKLTNFFTIAANEDIISVNSTKSELCQIINKVVNTNGKVIKPEDFKSLMLNKHNSTTFANIEIHDNGKDTKKQIFFKRKEFRANRIFTSERLTPLQSQIFKRAREMCIAKSILATWTKDGSIFYKKKEGDKGMLLTSITDIIPSNP